MKLRQRALPALAAVLVLFAVTVMVRGQSDCFNWPSWCWHDYEINCMATYSDTCYPYHCSVYMCHTCRDDLFCMEVWEDLFYCEGDNCAYAVCDGTCP